MTTDLFYLGITQRTAPLAVREALSPNPEKQRAMLDRLSETAPGRMVISTCERFELYAHTAKRDERTWLANVAHWFQLPTEMAAKHVRFQFGPAVARHLLRVSAGLDSRVLGEPQIQGQVRDAYLLATECAALDPVLSALGRSAIRTGKRVRHETPINRSGRSIPSLAVERIVQQIAMPQPKLLVLGSGRLAGDVASTWARRGQGEMTVIARNYELGCALAESHGAKGFGMERLCDAMAEADAVVACTAAPSFLIDPAAIGTNRTRPLCLVDLSVPRNIDPTVVQLPFVELNHLDDLLAGEANPARVAFEAEKLVEEEWARFERWRRERHAAQAVSALVRETEATPFLDQRTAKRDLHRRILHLKSREFATVAT